MRSLRRHRAVPAVLAATLLLAACGGEDADTGAEATTESTDDDGSEMTEDEMGEMSEEDMSEMDEGEMGEMSEDEMSEMDEGEIEEGHGDGDGGHDMGDMEMGDPDATPADEVDGAELRSGDFTLLAGAPDGFEDAEGMAFLATTDEGTWATARVTGLAPDTAYVSHVHADTCANDGGAHFKFDDGGSDVPPNEIHLGFTTDADGAAQVTATNEQVAGDDAMSIVIHAADGDTTKALCADLA